LLDDQRFGRKEPNMLIDADYHPRFQQIGFLVKETGEYSEQRLSHSDGETEPKKQTRPLPGVRGEVSSKTV
jgi:hypothetical protein